MPTPSIGGAHPQKESRPVAVGAITAPHTASVLRDPAFLTALVIAVVVALGFGLVVPVLPLLAADFDVGAFAVTAVISVFAGVRLVSNLYAGPLADRVGTRRAVGWGAIIVGVSSLAIAVAPSYWWLLVVRGLGGFGSALFFTSLLALVVRLVPSDQRGRSIGLLQGAFLFGLTVGPAVGGLLAEPLGLRWPFVVYAASCTLAGLVALRYLPRVEGGASQAGRPQGLGATWRLVQQLSRDRAFLSALVMMAAVRWSATGVRFSLVPLFGQELGAGAGMIGFAVALASVTQLAVVWPAGRASDWVGRKPVGVTAFALFGASTVALGLAGSVAAFLVLMGVYGAGTGLAQGTPPAIVADVTPAERTGTAVGVLNTAGDLGSVLGPLASGWLADAAGYSWGFGVAAAFSMAAALTAVRMRETLPPRV